MKTFVSRESDLWKKLYTSLVRPHLEYAVQAWRPYLEGNIQILERVQRRATRIPISHKGLDYESRLRLWGLTTLEKRRERGDLIQMYKIVHGVEEITWHTGPKYLPIEQDSDLVNAPTLTIKVFIGKG